MRNVWLALAALALACGGAPPVIDSPTDVPVTARAIGPGEHRGAFADGDPTSEDGAFVHAFRIDLEPERRVRLHLISADVDPVLEVRGPDDRFLSSDDAFPGQLDAMLDFVPPVRGTYEIRATTVNSGERGAYLLRVSEREPVGIGPAIALDTPVRAALGEHPGGAGVPGTWLHFEGRAGSIVRLRVTSTAFDTVATLLGPGGQTWVNDDGNELGPSGNERALDSTLIAALPESGVYQLIVTSYGRGEGPFAVRASVRAPIVRRGTEIPEGLAGAEGGGRILGLYAGITAYPTSSQLYGCADDARLLAHGLRAAGLQDERDQLVLPDGLATREAFLAGLAQITERARPEDVVLIFYSGHGHQLTSTGDEPRELDGLDESLALFDGDFTDDELAAAVDGIRAGTIVLAIDACHSGGFADDFVTRRGRMGLFSSDEDVLSATAEPHRAGGYLSWHLRRALLGEGDARPRDGVLHAGELADYVLDGYVTDHRTINPAHQIDRAQRLVLRRSIPYDQVLWVYPRNEDLSLPDVPALSLQSLPP